MSDKLSDWLPILTHPEAGERIRRAACVCVYECNGLRLDLGREYPDEDPLLTSDERVPRTILAALAHGVAVVIAADDYPKIVEAGGEWRIEMGAGAGHGDWATTLPAAWLAAARRVWLEGGE